MRGGGAPDLDDLVRLRRVRDRIDREHAQPLDVDQLYGVRDCAFRDPAGHLLRINQQR